MLTETESGRDGPAEGRPHATRYGRGGSAWRASGRATHSQERRAQANTDSARYADTPQLG
jgi:hypothetical protein